MGFNFTLPDDIHWETDDDGAKTRRFYDDNPRKVFCGDNVGPTINELPGEKRPVDIFQFFISDELLEKIAPSTNDWFQVKKGSEPSKHKAPFEPIAYINEWKPFFGMLLAVNQNIDLPRFEHYFRQDESKWLLLTPGFHKVFSQKRFSQLNRYIFFCDPQSLDENDRNRDKLAKVKPFLEHLHAGCKDNFNYGKNITIDEAMIPYKGKLSIKQRILGKPVRWGIKLFPLCDSETAYVSRFEVYLGKARDNEDTSAIGKGGAVFARLTNDSHHKGHCLFVDNSYSSLALCIFLKSRGIYLCGTTIEVTAGGTQLS